MLGSHRGRAEDQDRSQRPQHRPERRLAEPAADGRREDEQRRGEPEPEPEPEGEAGGGMALVQRVALHQGRTDAAPGNDVRHADERHGHRQQAEIRRRQQPGEDHYDAEREQRLPCRGGGNPAEAGDGAQRQIRRALAAAGDVGGRRRRAGAAHAAGARGGGEAAMPDGMSAISGRQPRCTASALARNRSSPASQVCPWRWRTMR